MPQYLSPGVYVEEVPSGIAPIAGVGTNTAGFVGVVDYCELELERSLLIGRTLKAVVFRKGLLITPENVDNVITAAQAISLERLNVRGLTTVEKEPLTGMKLLTDVSSAKKTFDAETLLDEKAADELATAINKPTMKVKVEGERGLDKALLEKMQLVDDLVLPMIDDSNAFGLTLEITAQNVETLITKLGKDNDIYVRVEPLTLPYRAKLIGNFAEYVRYFGGFSDESLQQDYLSRALYGFFDNGGTLCFVTRVEQGADDEQMAENLGRGLDTFNDIDEIALVAIPGCIEAIAQGKIVSHCENLQDRFAILDGQPLPKENGNEVDKTVATIQGEVRDSTYAAMYWPWLDLGVKIKNKEAEKPEEKEKTRYYPPSGHMAGIYARVDNTRGVHKAPANETIRGAKDVEHRISKAHHGLLNPNGINVIRKFDTNIKVYGARTLGGNENGEFKYINVRRLFLFLRESIDEGTQWVVFEPNTQELWQKIIRNINGFLTLVWRSGAFFGSTPQEAFFVKCDSELNPPEVREQGQVITQIGVAPVYPAEFVIFRISQIAGPTP
jgi:phage tail sheath protein FI